MNLQRFMDGGLGTAIRYWAGCHKLDETLYSRSGILSYGKTNLSQVQGS
jgi:hypothetical protein